MSSPGDGKESAWNAEDLGRPLGWEYRWRRAWQLTPVSFPGESPWTEEPGRLQSMGVRHDWVSRHSTQHRSSKNNDSLLLPFLNMKYFVFKYYWVQLAHFYNIFMFTRQFVYNILSAFLVKKKLIIFIFLAYFTLGGGRGDRDGEYM